MPACPRRWNWPSAATRSRCWKRARWAGAPRGATAARSSPATATAARDTFEAQLSPADVKRAWDISMEGLQLLQQRIARHAHRLRLHARLPEPGRQCPQGAARCSSACEHMDARTMATCSNGSSRRRSAAGSRARAFIPAPSTPRSGPPASAQVRAWPGRRGARRRRAALRVHGGAAHRAGPSHRGARPRKASWPAVTWCWPATPICSAFGRALAPRLARTHPAGADLHDRHRAHGAGARRCADPPARRRQRHQLRAGLLPPLGRSPPALRRRRQPPPDPAAAGGRRHAPPDAAGVSAAGATWPSPTSGAGRWT